MIPVAVIGSGPAGLAVAQALRGRGVEALVLEAGPTPSWALRQVDPRQGLVSPPGLSGLPGLRWPRGPLDFRAFVAGLDAWREREGLAVRTDARVEGVERVPGGFQLATPRGPVDARVVVACGGILSQPALPPFGPTPIPWWHSRDARAPDVQGRRALLVVGAGVSAGEILATWLATARPDDVAWLAHRGPVRMAPRRLLGLDTHYLVWPLEWLPGRLGRRRLGLTHEPLLDAAAQAALRSGRVQKVEAFQAFTGDGVLLAGGRRLTPDAVVFATGFHHTTPVDACLRHDAEGWPILRRCAAAPDLYVLGMRYGGSLASPFLRGIAREARSVARRVARHLQKR
ncbi:MAG: NAD(P)-binding domain-containing protein [Myxococcales bacterium]|nr:NAD(P)-binding domain-containing protein [Myxococcales bacterium]